VLAEKIEHRVKEQVNHPSHYGGADNPYEAIKVIEAWGLGFNLGNTVKYISRAGKKGDHLVDLQKALWYLEREVKNLQNEKLSQEQK
jgi:hypothetical protein